MNKVFYKKNDMPRAEGGMGLTSIYTSHWAATINTYKYIKSATDTNIKELINHEKTKPQTTSTVESWDKLRQTRKYSKKWIRTRPPPLVVNKSEEITWREKAR